MPKKKTTGAKKTTVKKNIKDVHENCLRIENLADVTEIVEKMMKEKLANPSVVHEGEQGLIFIEGEPHMVIDEKYVPHAEAELVFQTRKVVREYLVLQKMLNNK